MIYDEEAYKHVDYKKVYTKANEDIVVSSTINDFPFNVRDFIYEMSDIELRSYKKAYMEYSIHIPMFGSESAVLQEYEGRHIVFYNQDEPAYRVRFSVLHEYAHYILGHKMNLKKTDTLYHKQELEANCYAAQLLMPEQLLRKCEKRHRRLTVEYIMNSFSTSEEAAKKRTLTLARTNSEWKSREEGMFDSIIVTKYAHVLDRIAPAPNINVYVDYDDEYAKQRERESWYDSRTRYSNRW